MNRPHFNPEIEQFVASFLASGDEFQAFKETFKGKKSYVARTAKQDAKAFLLQPRVAERLALASREALRMKRLDAKAILERIAQLAFADLSTVAKVRRVNCRHCWGKLFKRQYTAGEYDDMCLEAFCKAQAAGLDTYEEPEIPAGGLGFDGTRSPHPDCPECFGEGHEEIFVQDFDKLDDDVKPLIAGVEHTRFGIKVSFHDQRASLEMLAKCFGLQQPDIALTVIQQMMPPAEKVVFDPADRQKAEEAYKRLLDA